MCQSMCQSRPPTPTADRPVPATTMMTMSKNLQNLIENILSSTGRTARAVVLIVTIGLVTGTVPGIQLPTHEPADAVVQHTPTR
jgi:hypothetical protein